MRMESVSEPSSPGPEQVGLEVRYTPVCGTDVLVDTPGPLLIPLHARNHDRRSLYMYEGRKIANDVGNSICAYA